MSHTSFIYLNCKQFDGTVFVTQIADWIRLFQENGVNFQYYHQFYGTEILHRKWCKDHLEKIKTVIPVIANVSFSLPEKYFFPKINAYILNYILNKRCKDSSRIVIFSRMLYGKEIAVLKKISRKEIIYIYDARGATMEEHKYQLMKDGFHLSEITPLLQHIADVEMATVQNSDLIFSVSDHLREYLSDTYSVNKDKFFIYPCLSDSNKFYYDEVIRKRTREYLGYEDKHHVYIYSGGLTNNYHLVDETLEFLDCMAASDPNARFLFLSKDNLDNEHLKRRYRYLLGKTKVLSVSNQEVCKFLNAADYGILFRDDVIMNNVASPSKFAEYVLCGLPTIISKGVGDFSELCIKYNLGILIDSFKLSPYDKERLINNDFDRLYIANYGKSQLSKQSQLSKILSKFKLYI